GTVVGGGVAGRLRALAIGLNDLEQGHFLQERDQFLGAIELILVEPSTEERHPHRLYEVARVVAVAERMMQPPADDAENVLAIALVEFLRSLLVAFLNPPHQVQKVLLRVIHEPLPLPHGTKRIVRPDEREYDRSRRRRQANSHSEPNPEPLPPAPSPKRRGGEACSPSPPRGGGWGRGWAQ